MIQILPFIDNFENQKTKQINKTLVQDIWI